MTPPQKTDILKNILDTTIPACDGQTDRQTAIFRYQVPRQQASRG